MSAIHLALGAARADALTPPWERRIARRSAPERLRFETPSPQSWTAVALDLPRRERRPSALRRRLGLALVALGNRLAGAQVAS